MENTPYHNAPNEALADGNDSIQQNDSAESALLSPFHNFLAIFILLSQQVVGLLIVKGTVKLLGISLPSDHGLSILSSGVGSFVTVGIILLMMYRKKIDFVRLWGTWSDFARHWKHILLVVPLMLVSIGFGGLGFALLAKVAPEFVRDILTSFTVNDATYGASIKMLIALLGCLLIPICEEVMFRGTILYRFASYKTMRSAVISSAILFACLHPHNPLGTFIFAYSATVAYIYTRSLLIPISIHILNNSIGLALFEYTPFQSPIWTSDNPSITDLQQIPLNDFLLLFLFLAIGSTIVWRYLKTNPINDETQLPYFAASNQAADNHLSPSTDHL